MTTLRIASGIRDNFFIGSNDFARDPNITPRAAKVYIYLISHREGWKISVKSVSKATGMGKNTVAAALRDLEGAGFIERRRIKDEFGKFTGTEYLIHIERQPQPKNGDTAGQDQEPKNGPWNDQQKQNDDAGQSQNPENGPWDDQQEQGVSAGRVQNPENGPLKKTNISLEDQEKTHDHPADDRFSEFWSTVPRKVGKKKARVEWTKALKEVDADTIIDAMRRYRDDPNRVDAFTKHPTTWLSNGCWEDDPLPPREAPRKINGSRSGFQSANTPEAWGAAPASQPETEWPSFNDFTGPIIEHGEFS